MALPNGNYFSSKEHWAYVSASNGLVLEDKNPLVPEMHKVKCRGVLLESIYQMVL